MNKTPPRPPEPSPPPPGIHAKCAALGEDKGTTLVCGRSKGHDTHRDPVRRQHFDPDAEVYWSGRREFPRPATDPRRSLRAAAKLGADLGYTVRETDLRDINGQVMLDLDGHGKLFEVYFAEDRRTGYLRFDRVFMDVGRSGDTFTTWKVGAERIRQYAGRQS